MHTTATAGSVIHLRAGGDWYYDLAEDLDRLGLSGERHLALIGGGIGVGPLYSIYKNLI